MCGGASAGGGSSAGAVGSPSQRTKPAAHLLYAYSPRQEVWWGAHQGGCTGGIHLCYLPVPLLKMPHFHTRNIAMHNVPVSFTATASEVRVAA